LEGIPTGVAQHRSVVSAQTQSKIVVERGEATVHEELLVLARSDEAATLGDDTIVALRPAVYARQDFEAYRCRDQGSG